MPLKILYIEWAGPYDFEDLEELQDESCDYGVYQIYGMHPVYGEEVLLYLGQTDNRTFSAKLAQEKEYWDAEADFHPLSIYVGRLAGQMTPGDEVWGEEIDQAARLLIYAHVPVFNARDLGAPPEEDLKEMHLVNWGTYLDLAPEVSGVRWLYKFVEMPHYNIYGKHGKHGD